MRQSADPTGAIRALLAPVMAGALLLGGAGWAQPQAPERVPISAVPQIHGIVVDREDPAALKLATADGIFWARGGLAELISDRRDDFRSFAAHPVEPQVFYASGHLEGRGNLGVLLSRDGGRTWEELSPGANGPVGFRAMDVSPADPQVIYGLHVGVQVSRDGGATWEIASVPPFQLFDLAASPADADTVYAAAQEGLMVSRDAGRSWEPAHAAGRPASLVRRAPDGSLFAFILGEGLFRAAAPDGAWENVIGDAFGDRVLLNLAFDPADPQRLLASTERSELLESTDGGHIWSWASR